MILGIIQLIVLVLPLIILYKFAETHGALPFDIALQFDAFNIAQYAVLLIASYFLFTAFCVAIGAVSPTAKDANSFSSVIIILTILPLFFINALTGEPQAMAYFLTYFPPSAPITIMFRGVFGNLAPWEFWVGLADIVIVSALVAKLATHLFRRNAIDFTSKVSLKKLFGSPRTTWKN
jgi:ABC-2 type transport system permease protein